MRLRGTSALPRDYRLSSAFKLIFAVAWRTASFTPTSRTIGGGQVVAVRNEGVGLLGKLKGMRQSCSHAVTWSTTSQVPPMAEVHAATTIAAEQEMQLRENRWAEGSCI